MDSKKPEIPKFLKMIIGERTWEMLNAQRGAKFEKTDISGAGCFRNEFGVASLNSNVLVRSWNQSWMAVFSLGFFALFWNAIVGIVMFGMFTSDKIKVNGRAYESIQAAFPEHPWMLVFLIFPLIGLIFAYSVFCLLANRSRYSVDYNQLHIKHGPLPAKRNLILPRGHVKQFFVQRSIVRSNNSSRYKYRVMAKLHDGRDKVVEDSLGNYQDARRLEQWLESRMGITDELVPGELGA